MVAMTAPTDGFGMPIVPTKAQKVEDYFSVMNRGVVRDRDGFRHPGGDEHYC